MVVDIHYAAVHLSVPILNCDVVFRFASRLRAVFDAVKAHDGALALLDALVGRVNVHGGVESQMVVILGSL